MGARLPVPCRKALRAGPSGSGVPSCLWLSCTRGWVQLWHGWRSCRARWLPNPVWASLSHGSEATSVPAGVSSPQGSWNRNVCKSSVLSGMTSLSMQVNIWVVAFPKPSIFEGIRKEFAVASWYFLFYLESEMLLVFFPLLTLVQVRCTLLTVVLK